MSFFQFFLDIFKHSGGDLRPW